MRKIAWDEGTVRSVRTRRKTLTMYDIATLMKGDEELKNKLAEALAGQMRQLGHDEPDLESRAYGIVHTTLLALSGTPRVRYHICCAACGTHEILETGGDARSAIRYTCCGCGRSGEVVLPEATEVLCCPDCGIESTLQRVDLEV